MSAENPKYLAFISYSRSDNEHESRRWADWVKETIERFPIPINYLDPESTALHPSRLSREVFLDQSYITAGGELRSKLNQHLQDSEFLVLLCSPRSAASEYVAFEINHFKESGKWDKIIPVVIDGEDSPTSSGGCWLPGNLPDAVPGDPADGPGTGKQVGSLVYADFRVKEKRPDNSVLVSAGWTDPASYEKHLKKENRHSEQDLQRLVASYRKSHSVAKYALLGALFGMEPRQLAEDALLEENERRRQKIREHRRKAAIYGMIALVMAGLALLAFHSYRVAERERRKSERSLQLIGDAHEDASRLVADVLINLRSNLEPDGPEGAFDKAKRIVDEHLDENERPGDDNDSLHMRAVVLNSRGYLARSTGDFAAAGGYYMEALGLREELLRRDGAKAMYRHNLAVSHDDLGDLHAAKALELRKQGKDPAGEFEAAIAEYRKGLDQSRLLIAREDVTPQWRHDVAVSYFKVGDALFEAGYPGEALAELLEGFPIAEQVAASDPAYAKWQAQLGLYCLELGRIQALSARTADARATLLRGKKIFQDLRERGQLSRHQTAWLERIDEILLDLE
jgi:tetratricopeptide (TPR) repeat protein